ncbi:hypothetical protein N8878_06315 [Psychromonas sp.]|nr:hypothetical protein [Psychromonas sp.]
MNRLLLPFSGLILSIFISPASLAVSPEPFRILHVMSYHPDWEWNIDQLQGFKDGIGDLEVDYKIVALDTKNADEKEIQLKVQEAKKTIAEWQPNLLYSNDDNAQKYLAQFYTNTSLPIVFSAVNLDPAEYGFDKAKNVTGVMEYEHFIPTINLLRSMVGDIDRIAIIIDDDPTWIGVTARIREHLKNNKELEVTEWILVNDYTEYKTAIKSLQNKVDAVGLLGIFNLEDESNKVVDYTKVLEWTAEHSQLLDFSFWESRVDSGTLCAVAVSGYEQGLIAGQMARKILKQGMSPSDIPIQSSDKGEPMISLPRVKDLNLNIDVQLLLDNTVKKHYSWKE